MFVFKETLKHVAKTVAHVNLSDHLVDVVFVLFDENGKKPCEKIVAMWSKPLVRYSD